MENAALTTRDIFFDGNENEVTTSKRTTTSSLSSSSSRRGVLGNITNRNSASFAYRQKGDEEEREKVKKKGMNFERIEEAHYAAAEDAVMLGKAMEEVILEYNERVHSHFYYFSDLEARSSGLEVDDVCRFEEF